MNRRLEQAVRYFNLASTTTGKSKARMIACMINAKLHIDYSQNTNLYTIICKFVKEYENFKKDYDKIRKITSFGNLDYFGSNFSDKVKSIFLLAEGGEKFLVLVKENAKYKALLKDDIFIGAEVYIPKEIIDGYMNLVIKYEDFLNAYAVFKEKSFLFGNGCSTFSFRVKGNVLDRIEYIRVSFGNTYLNTEDYFEFQIDLTKKDKRIKNNLTHLDGKKIDLTRYMSEYLFNKVYLNNKYLPSLYNKPKVHYKNDGIYLE